MSRSGCGPGHPQPPTIRLTETKRLGFGNSVLSKAAGMILGVARKATVIVVRYIDVYGQRSNPHGIDAFLQTYDDIKKRNSSSKVVVEFSTNFAGNVA